MSLKFITGDWREKIVNLIIDGNLEDLKIHLNILDPNSILVKPNSNPNDKNNYKGVTLLGTACEFNRKDVVKLLLESGAKNNPDYCCYTAAYQITPFEDTIANKKYDLALLIDECLGPIKQDSYLVPKSLYQEYNDFKLNKKGNKS